MLGRPEGRCSALGRMLRTEENPERGRAAAATVERVLRGAGALERQPRRLGLPPARPSAQPGLAWVPHRAGSAVPRRRWRRQRWLGWLRPAPRLGCEGRAAAGASGGRRRRLGGWARGGRVRAAGAARGPRGAGAGARVGREAALCQWAGPSCSLLRAPSALLPPSQLCVLSPSSPSSRFPPLLSLLPSLPSAHFSRLLHERGLTV